MLQPIKLPFHISSGLRFRGNWVGVLLDGVNWIFLKSLTQVKIISLKKFFSLNISFPLVNTISIFSLMHTMKKNIDLVEYLFKWHILFGYGYIKIVNGSKVFIL